MRTVVIPRTDGSGGPARLEATTTKAICELMKTDIDTGVIGNNGAEYTRHIHI